MPYERSRYEMDIPKRKPSMRKKASLRMAIITVCLVLAMGWLFITGNPLQYDSIFVLIGAQASAHFILPELLRRSFLCYFLWREEGKYAQMTGLFKFNSANCIAITCTIVLYIVGLLHCDDNALTQWKLHVLTLVLHCGFYAMYQRLGTLETDFDIQEKFQEHKMSMARSFALLYYYGYLRLILPTPEDIHGQKDIRERITDWEEDQQQSSGENAMRGSITVPVKKLIILLPESAVCHGVLDKLAPEGELSVVDNPKLTPIKRNRAGVWHRTYSSTIYRLAPTPDDPRAMYVVAEYATPLLTLLEMQGSLGKDGGLSKDELQCEVVNFCQALKEVLESDPKCANLYSLLFYHDRNEDGEIINMAQLLREHVNALRTELK